MPEAADGAPEQKATISDAAPMPLRSFDTFPSPDDLFGSELRVCGIRYIEEHGAVSPLDVRAYA